ncbi:fungal specific transcription factor domain-containing protein [Cordyceps javanica]|uniref:Fungal specific transcription factor domain-containing protein n=1 Tax=Cordyceps javanica TaxID=43265 RepID=A0A545UYI5_9HYPO|nr:fungal specific transcription factor domain-containing protein [Cordyceps javanica]TQW06372.1 fungal specific transcription factor domain-containing protein [Cordyceps javanica]
MADRPGEDGGVNDLTPDEVSRIIHSHRKVRYATTIKPSNAASSAATSRKRRHSEPEELEPESSHKSDRQESWPRAIGTLDEAEPVSDRYVGQNSIPALLREQSTSSDKNDSVDIRRDMRSILGLDNSAPFPLMSQHHLHRIAQDISTELPSDREVMKLFRSYKEIPQPFWGFVVDIDDFESKLMVYLEERSRNASKPNKSSRPVSASWLAILFAVLAVGSQYHESPYHIRTRDSQKYLQISFHFLRLANFLLRPSFDSIQALLLMSFTLLNDMKAEASWALTGLTCRLAQSLGLHRPNAPDTNENGEPNTKEMTRRKLWWKCVWHDTLTSLSFDRSPMTNFPSCSIPVRSQSSTGEYAYLEMMYHLIEIISRRLNPDAMAAPSYAEIVENCDAVEALRTRASAHMKDKDKCKTALDRLQHFAIRLHTSFVISVACRPALRRNCNLAPEQKKTLAARCVVNLTETVKMFLAMHQLSVIPTRSWAFTYHGLSSALLLGILCDTRADPEVRQLQGDLIAALSATAAKEASSPEPHVIRTDKDIELSGPLWRALTALKSIYDHGTITNTFKRDGDSSTGGSGTRTPLMQLPPGVQGVPLYQQYRAIPPGSDPREDAALAMAEMQNGASLQDFQNALSAPPQVPMPVGFDGLNAEGPQLMAPMDLYESIWGESPDPWNPGAEPMTFDFLAQPPPGQPHHQLYF